MTTEGVIKVIYDEKRISEKFNTREFVLTIGPDTQYPQHVSFTLVNNNCDFIIGKHVGDHVEVHFNLKGREWTNPQGEVKYYNTLEAWRIYKRDAR